MRLSWTVEKDHSIVLREPGQAARAVVKHRENDWGYVVHILEPGFPGAGPYKSMTEAAEWAQKTFKARFVQGATFSIIPKVIWTSGKKRKAA